MLGLVTLPRFGVAQQLGLPAHFNAIAKEIGEDGDLGLEDRGLNRRRHVVHGAERVSLSQLGLHRVGCEKQNWRVPGEWALADDAHHLEPVHIAYVNVEQDRRKLFLQQAPLRLARRTDADDPETRLLENARERQQVLTPVVENEDADGVHGDGVGRTHIKVPSKRLTIRRAEKPLKQPFWHDVGRAQLHGLYVSRTT